MTIANTLSCRCGCRDKAELPLKEFKATNFRCLASIELELDASANLICGPNGAGKTSVLEGIAYLGRGKSFRGASTSQLVRHGEAEFVVFGRVEDGPGSRTLAARNGRDGLEVRVDGDGTGGVAALAEALPVQIVDPDVHALVGGGPEQRRRFLDWIAFHVEPGYLDLWRRFRRVLKQRNAALRTGCSVNELEGWDQAFAGLGTELDRAKRGVFEIAVETLEGTAGELLMEAVGFEYRQGWPVDEDLAESLRKNRERDQKNGATQNGPHRADVAVRYDERLARKLVSRGQQKLLACSMILGATELAQTALEKPILLLLDDPAAELDKDSLSRLMGWINGLGCQIVATSLVPDPGLFAADPAVFHVEHGSLTAA